MDCRLPGSSIHGIFQSRVVEWVAIAFSGRTVWKVQNYQLNLSSLLRQWHPTPVLLTGKSHGWRSLVGYSPWGRWESDTTERLHFDFSFYCIGEGNGNPLQCSGLENPRDGGAWWAAIYGGAQSRTRLKWLSSSSSSMYPWAILFNSAYFWTPYKMYHTVIYLCTIFFFCPVFCFWNSSFEIEMCKLRVRFCLYFIF